MMKKWVLVLFTIALASTVGIWMTVRFPYLLPRTTFRARYDQVELGMTHFEVLMIMNGSGDCPKYPTTLSFRETSIDWYESDHEQAKFWYSPDGKVDSKDYQGWSWEPDWLEATWKRKGIQRGWDSSFWGRKRGRIYFP
jgi:hypothetical protein